MTSETSNKTLDVVVISDTHNRHDSLALPSADILIHCGDFTMRGLESEVKAFDSWLESVAPRFRAIVVIAGNHDFLFQDDSEKGRALLRHAT